MLQVSKHVFLNYCLLVTVKIWISWSAKVIQSKVTRCQQCKLYYSLLRSWVILQKQLWKDGIWKYISSFIHCPNIAGILSLYVKLMPAKHTISFTLLDCKQVVGLVAYKRNKPNLVHQLKIDILQDKQKRLWRGNFKHGSQATCGDAPHYFVLLYSCWYVWP